MMLYAKSPESLSAFIVYHASHIENQVSNSVDRIIGTVSKKA